MIKQGTVEYLSSHGNEQMKICPSVLPNTLIHPARPPDPGLGRLLWCQRITSLESVRHKLYISFRHYPR